MAKAQSNPMADTPRIMAMARGDRPAQATYALPAKVTEPPERTTNTRKIPAVRSHQPGTPWPHPTSRYRMRSRRREKPTVARQAAKSPTQADTASKAPARR